MKNGLRCLSGLIFIIILGFTISFIILGCGTMGSLLDPEGVETEISKTLMNGAASIITSVPEGYPDRTFKQALIGKFPGLKFESVGSSVTTAERFSYNGRRYYMSLEMKFSNTAGEPSRVIGVKKCIDIGESK